MTLHSLMKRAAEETVDALSTKRGKKGFWTDSIKPEYYFEAGLRKVKPYFFEYKTYAKERWYGRPLLEVFKGEFRDRTVEYYRRAMQEGLVTVNGAKVIDLEEYRVKNGDMICHKIHRHEPPITAEPIKIIYQDAEMLIVNKPASVPVHPSGRYRFNTLVEILRAEHGFQHLSIINRLDRLTSGIVMLGLERGKAVSLHEKMQSREYQKTYICRVKGRFPAEARCNAPIKAIEHKLGLVNVASDGKPSETHFKLLKYYEELDESLVEAKPMTGRTHQIRVHLQALGHPILNDHLYNNPVWETVDPVEDPSIPYKCYSEASLKQVAEELLRTTFNDEVTVESDQPVNAESLCPECEIQREDPSPEKLCIYLHAKRYACDDFEYETEMPFWA